MNNVNLRKLSLLQKECVRKLGEDPDNYLRISQNTQEFKVINLRTGKVQPVKYWI